MDGRGDENPRILKTLTASDQDLVRPVLITQLGSITLARFLFWSVLGSPFHREYEQAASTYEFDGDLLVVQKVGALENDTKRTLTDLLAHTIVDTHYVRGGRRHGEWFTRGMVLRTRLWITG